MEEMGVTDPILQPLATAKRAFYNTAWALSRMSGEVDSFHQWVKTDLSELDQAHKSVVTDLMALESAVGQINMALGSPVPLGNVTPPDLWAALVHLSAKVDEPLGHSAAMTDLRDWVNALDQKV